MKSKPEPAPDTFGARLNIRQLSRLTGRTRETIAKRLAGVPHVTTANRAKTYDSRAALEAIFTLSANSEADSRRLLNDARRELARLQAETIRKERIPLDDIAEINDRALSNVAGILKSRLGKLFDDATLQDLFAELRGIGERLRELGPATEDNRDAD